MTRSSLVIVVLDTAVQEKTIAYPTDSRLLDRVRGQLVEAVRDDGIRLRESYAHARQY